MESSAKNFKVFFDISETEIPDFQELCPLNLGYDQGETLDTFYTLCSERANNVKTALDETWSTGFKFDKDDAVAQFLIAKEDKTGLAATCDVKLVNLLKGTAGKQKTFTATLSGISYEAVTEEVWQIDFDMKIYKASTYLEEDYVAV